MAKKPMTETEVRGLPSKKNTYAVSTGYGIRVHVQPNGSKYLTWEYLFPPIKTGKRRVYYFGTYGKESEGLWSLKKVSEEKYRLDALRKQGQDPDLLKSTDKKEIEQTATYT